MVAVGLLDVVAVGLSWRCTQLDSSRYGGECAFLYSLSVSLSVFLFSLSLFSKSHSPYRSGLSIPRRACKRKCTGCM